VYLTEQNYIQEYGARLARRWSYVLTLSGADDSLSSTTCKILVALRELFFCC